MEPLNTMWNSSFAKFFQFASRNFLQANSMQHTATTKKNKNILQDRTMRRTYNL